MSNNVIFSSVFVHETMHYLGITPVKNSNEGEYFIEGLTDALAQKCMEYLGKNFIGSDIYDMQKNLCMQILVVDHEIIKNAVTQDDFDIMSRIDERLKNVKRSMFDYDNISNNLECCISSLFYGTAGEYSDLIILQAQDIVASYVKTFNPSKNQIDKIRKYYIIKNYEKVKLVKEGNSIYVDNLEI